MKTKELVYAALFAAFVAVLGMLPPLTLGFIPVPITAQTLGVMLAGCFLGRRMGFLSLVIFILLAAIGLPVLAGGQGGLGALAGPSAGYIFSWPLVAFLIGYGTEKVWASLRTWKLIIINLVFGVLLTILIGSTVMSLILHTPVWAGLMASAVYLPGDILKAVIAAVLAVRLKAVSPIEESLQRR